MTGSPLKSNKRIQDKLKEELGENDRRILLGVTGGVASGKTTVARMIEKLGAPTIDFDLLSRIVVAPNKPAWEEILTCFGKQVLLADKSLDREKLSRIVFSNPAQRRKLEDIIHPRIFEEFARRVRHYTAREPHAIIQAVVPLLFEAHMQHLFDKILLVYIPPAMQAERLMRRDGISRELAANIINAQLPIESKKGDADFVIDNSGTLRETARQVRKVWGEIKRWQEAKVFNERRGKGKLL